MVLNELGNKISEALASISNAETIDEKVLDACLKEIATALLQADVNVKLVMNLRNNVKARANNADRGAGLNKRKIIEKAVMDELCSLLDATYDDKKKKEEKEFKKGQPNVVMFVGLQGSGKTTTCGKYGAYYKKKGFKPALVCADTFRAGAFDQLKQNASKLQIPFFGSYEETDPAKIAEKGVDMFKKDKKDLIIVDTSGRHKQEEALFEEMRQVAVSVEPDLVIFVMDGSIGQAAFDQAKAFRDSVEVGQVIITKMDGHAKGGGALSAVSATRAPISFIGTGEHMDEFERFDAKSFVARLLGRGDWRGFVDKFQDVVPDAEGAQEELMETISKGNFTMRILYEQLSNIRKMGPVSQLMGMVPGFSNSGLFTKGKENESQARIKKFMTMMDSMTDKELDNPNPKIFEEPSRLMRIAKGSGQHPYSVKELVEEYKRLRQVIVGPKGNGGLMKNMGKTMGSRNALNPNSMQQLARQIPPDMLRQLGGASGLQGLMKQMEKMGVK